MCSVKTHMSRHSFVAPILAAPLLTDGQQWGQVRVRTMTQFRLVTLGVPGEYVAFQDVLAGLLNVDSVDVQASVVSPAISSFTPFNITFLVLDDESLSHVLAGKWCARWQTALTVKTSGKHSLLPRKVTLQWFSGGPDKFGGGMYRDSSCRVDDASLCSVRSLNTTGGVHRASACLVYGVSFSRVRGGNAIVEVQRDSTRQVCDASVLAVAILCQQRHRDNICRVQSASSSRARSTSSNGRACSCTLSGVSVATARAVHAAPAAVAEYTS